MAPQSQTEYRVLEGCPADQLEGKLNALAEDGWVLQDMFPAAGTGRSGYDVVFVRRKEQGAAAGFHAAR
jgi:hypothetical protein